MAGAGSGGRIGGSNSPPRPPVFRSEAEQKKWNRSEGARKRSARRWTNWGLTPPGKLAHYGNSGEGSSSGASSRALAPPVADSSSSEEEEEEELPVHNLQLQSADYVLNDEEEATAVHQISIMSAAEARVLPPVREYEAAQKEPLACRVKKEVVDLDSE